jgi:HSP20 family molecular chaperone IbpA
MSKQQRTAGNLVLCNVEQPIVLEVDEVQSRIRQRAFELSVDRNHAGRELADWLAAESEVIVSPPVEVAERAGEFIIRIAASGIDPNDLTLMATRDRILVKSEFRHEHEPDAEIHSCEFKSTTLFRSIRLPHPIDLRSIKTELLDGILKITAKREGATPEVTKPKPRKRTQPTAKSRKRL